MRPLDKGPWPVDINGQRITVNDYDHWRALLIERIGYYCAYCNMPLSHSLQVEHVVPKNPPPGYVPGDPLSWDNMLLACGPCNRAKWNTPINFDDYYFPDHNNTLIPFQHVVHPVNPDSAIVVESPGLQAAQLSKASSSIRLFGLANIDKRPDIVDIRHIKRRDALIAVDMAYTLYVGIKVDNPDLVQKTAELIAQMAKGWGFFGIWFRKFQDEPKVIKALIDPVNIKGTHQGSFDAVNGYGVVNRNPQNVADLI